MKNRIKTLLALHAISILPLVSLAQTANELEIKEETSKFVLPSLEVFIDSALVKNGMLEYRTLEIEAKEYNLTSKRQNWTRNLGIQANSGFGTFNNISTTSGENDIVNLASNTQQFNYNVGVYLKIPVFDIINRKTQIKQAKTELEQAKSLAKFQEQELREFVIRYYEDLILKQKILLLRSSNLGNAKVNMEMVEKEFRNGLIPISEYVRISDMTARIATEFEQAKSDYSTSKGLLENLTGIEIN